MNFLDPTLITTVLINLLLMLFAHKILSTVYHEPDDSPGFRNRVNIFRALNGVIIIAVVTSHYFDAKDSTNLGHMVVSILVVLYLSYAAMHLLSYGVRTKFGKKKELGGETTLVDTYNSRLINIFTGIFVFIIALVSIIRILGYDSLLEAGGAIGLVGVFLALTQSAWAPDILSGLIILNSKMMDVGDVVEFNDGEKMLGVVFKTRIFYTEMLNVTNNHRIMIKNSKLREQTIHNLSKFASAKGLREQLSFKIDYAVEPSKVREMFNKAFDRAVTDPDICLEENYPIEVGIQDTGDYAIEWYCYYYTKDIRHIIRTRQLFREVILNVSKEMDISLATPQLHVIEK